MSDDKNKETVFVTVGKAALLTGLDSQTIRKMADKSTILCYRTHHPDKEESIHLVRL
jgi:hypothetical protein